MTTMKGIVAEGSEMNALVERMGGISSTPSLDRLDKYTGKQYRRGQALIVALLFVCTFVLIIRYEEVGEWLSAHEEDVDDKSSNDDHAGEAGLSDESRRSLPELIESLAAARVRIDDMIKADYGEYSFVFSRNETMSGNGIWWPTKASLTRLKRKMKRKVIESQLRVGGDHNDKPVTFNWVTGGHSAAAAHGNLLEQSYDVMMQSAAEIAFGAIGITFKTKHYGMGSAASAELSLCQDEIYGLDIDVLHWDFGMTDGRNYWYYHLWVDQAGLHPTFPILFANDERRKGINAACEQRGQGSFNLCSELPRKKLPDSDTHPNPNSLPRGVAHYMCGGQAEQSGTCKEKKFDTKWCNCRGKVSWHPGWKDHLFVGRFLAMFLVENLVDAVKEMHERDIVTTSTEGNSTNLLLSHPSLSQKYLDELIAEENADKQLFLASNVTNDIGSGASIGQENWKRVLRSNPICHSLRLPSQARFDGILDGVHAREASPGGFHAGVDQHYKWDTLPKPGLPSDNDTMKSAIPSLRPPWMMAIDQEMRVPMNYYGYEKGCNLTVSHDFRDGFVVRHEDDWMGDMYPSDAEIDFFSRGVYEREGLIVMCDTQCLFANCKPGGEVWSLANVGLPEKNGNVSILVDDVPVTAAIHVFTGCYFLVGENGNPKWGPGTKNGRKGQYEIKFKVLKPGKIILSSLVVI